MRKHINIPVFILIAVMILTAFTGCKKANIDDPVTIDNANISSVNAASAFIQSVFTDDEEMFYIVFPESAFSGYIEEGNDPFADYRSMVDPEFDYAGVSFAREEIMTVENGYDVDYLRISIALAHTIQESSIQSVSLVKLRVFFTKEGDKDFATTDVYIVTYKVDDAWYVFELANSDADFKA